MLVAGVGMQQRRDNTHQDKRIRIQETSPHTKTNNGSGNQANAMIFAAEKIIAKGISEPTRGTNRKSAMTKLT